MQWFDEVKKSERDIALNLFWLRLEIMVYLRMQIKWDKTDLLDPNKINEFGIGEILWMEVSNSEDVAFTKILQHNTTENVSLYSFS